MRRKDRERSKSLSEIKTLLVWEAKGDIPSDGMKPTCKKCGSRKWFTAAWTEKDTLFPFACLDCPDWTAHH